MLTTAIMRSRRQVEAAEVLICVRRRGVNSIDDTADVAMTRMDASRRWRGGVTVAN